MELLIPFLHRRREPLMVMGPLLLFGLLRAAGAGLPPASPPTPSMPKPSTPDALPPPGQRARLLAERGHPLEAALQLIEDIAAVSTGNTSCTRISLQDTVSRLDWSMPHTVFENQVRAALKTANILNHYFLTALNDTEVR